jgi:sn-2 palmitoyl-lipid 9-desaturase
MAATIIEKLAEPSLGLTETAPNRSDLLFVPQASPEKSAPPARRTLPGRWSNGLDWRNVLWIGLLHVGALAAPFFFTWQGLLLALGLGWVTGGLGICLGYHRLLTHRSFQTSSFMRRLLGLLGTLAGQGPPVAWVAVHRKHHQHADKKGDPHSPHDGAWWSHVLWLFPRPRNPQYRRMIDRYAKDLLQDPFMRLLDSTYLCWHFALALAQVRQLST